MSVTDKLHNAPREGLVVHLDGTLGNLLPRDPAFNVRKRLDVDYSYESDTVIHLSRLEPPLGETMRLVLPEDTEVQRLEKETQGCAELKEIAKQDAEKMGERLHVCGKRADFYYQPAFDPYIDMFIELVNSSVFEIVTFGELVGHARYANNPLSSPPRIEAHSRFDVGPPLVTVKHGAKATLIIRQPLSRGVADLMVAQQSKGIPLRFDGVAVSFKRLGILGVQTFGWYGIPEITIEEARRI